jgi:uncharacterized protein (DUF4415 family)
MEKDISFQLGDQSHMKDATTGRTSKAKNAKGTDWNRLRTMSAKEIRAGIKADPDAHPTDAAFWKNAKVVMPDRKVVVTMRLDADLLAWFRKQRGYQTRINAILRTYMQANG